MTLFEQLMMGLGFIIADVANSMASVVAPALIGLAVVALGISLGTRWVKRIRSAV